MDLTVLGKYGPFPAPLGACSGYLFESAKTAIDLVIRRKVPRSTDLYYLTSLIRLSGDHVYISKIKELIKYRQEKINRQNYQTNKVKVLKRSI